MTTSEYVVLFDGAGIATLLTRSGDVLAGPGTPAAAQIDAAHDARPAADAEYASLWNHSFDTDAVRAVVRAAAAGPKGRPEHTVL